jgi:hypothetical protein
MKVRGYGFDEEVAVHRLPHGRQCKERQEGLPHRVGIFPMSSSIDGGISGCYCEGICIHCGHKFPSLGSFVVINQPHKIRGC